ESPRGRIFMMRGALEGKIPVNPALLRHLDSCLMCQKCESICPSGVKYGRLLEGVRAELEPVRGRTWRETGLRRLVLRGLLGSSVRLRLTAALMRRVRWGFGIARRIGLLRRLGLEGMAQIVAVRRSGSWRKYYPAQGLERGEVGLFLGCAARVTDDETLRASVFVLNRLGYAVRVPPGQGCCGALHRQMGDSNGVPRLAQANRTAFAGLSAVLLSASGCGASLRDALESSGVATHEISGFLDCAEGWESADIAPLPASVWVHDPCSLRNALRAAEAPYRLLQRIPGLRVESLPGNDQCCGGAGAYMLTQPVMAQALRDDKMNAVRVSDAHLVATSNVGCSLHLQQGLRQAGMEAEVLHPVVLLARQMGFKTAPTRG
ncbi:MAG: (Fe-S)-binding protein, partial [Sulfuricellaceae bacterium]|nr:(Fe-S)-binding protein [Sulfuricellaceae bacterium]